MFNKGSTMLSDEQYGGDAETDLPMWVNQHKMMTALGHWVCHERNRLGTGLSHLPCNERTCPLDLVYNF